MGGGGGGASWKLKKAARKLFVQTCGSFCHRQLPHLDTSTATGISCDPANYPENQARNIPGTKISSEIGGQGNTTTSPSNKSLCAICLDPLNYSSGSSPGQAIFTAQCSHAFHFACISSNVRHGSITCPICRAQWTQLPRNLNPRSSLHSNKADPILQILDDSIANYRVHRRSFLRSARYDDDDPIDPVHVTAGGEHPRLHLSLSHHPSSSTSSSLRAESPHFPSPGNGAHHHLRLKLSPQPATDIVLVACPDGPHLRLMKQAMALAIFSLRPVDRLAIVACSSSTVAAARGFPLRRMTSHGKRAALEAIDRLSYSGRAADNPTEGLRKGVKILADRAHKNARACILHLTDGPSRSHRRFDPEVSVAIHRFHVGFGYGASSGLVMHELEEFLARALGGAIRTVQLRVGEGVVGIGELRGGEERNVAVYVGGGCGPVCVEYSYVEGSGDGECVRRGEMVVVGEKEDDDGSESDGVFTIGARMSSGESWGYHDPFMARRWAKHLHGYGL